MMAGPVRLILALAMAGAPACARPASPAQAAFERQVLAELNRVRQDPAAYVATLARYRGWFHARLVRIPGETALATDEGVVPVNEAIATLGRLSARRPLAEDQVLAASAADHVADQSRSGAVGHVGGDGSTPGDRVERHGGSWEVAEMVTYGAETPADVVRQLVVDDGVPDRGHRRLLFSPNLAVAGIACGPHPVYRTMCVIDLADAPQDSAHRAWRVAWREEDGAELR